MLSSNLATFRATIANLEAQGYICSAWNVNGTGDIRIVYGDCLDIEWMVEMASNLATLVY